MEAMNGEFLKSIARNDDMDTLEEAWLEALDNPGPAHLFLDALDCIDPEVRKESSIELLPLVFETYERLKRSEDALLIARRMARLKPKDPSTRRGLMRQIREVYKGEVWLEAFLRGCRLDEGVALDKGLDLFDSFEPYKPGVGVEHKAGWGVGVIECYNEMTWDIKVRFEDGFMRELPLTSATESLVPLDPDEFRVMLMTRRKELAEMAKENPALALRKALALRPGKKLGAAKIKEILVEKVIPPSEWQRWWTRAKKAAFKDPYLLVEGGSRPVFKLRDEPVSLDDEAMDAVQAEKSITDVVDKVRVYLGSTPGKELKQGLLDEVSKRVDDMLASGETGGVLLDAILLLEEHGADPSVSSDDMVRELLTGEEEEEEGAMALDLAELLGSVPTGRGKALALTCSRRAFPEKWAKLLCRAYDRLPQSLLDPAAHLMIKEGRTEAEALMARFRKLMESPWQAPWPIYYLARKVLGNAVDNEVAGTPGDGQVVLALLRCLESPLLKQREEKKSWLELIKRYEELFFDPKRKPIEKFVLSGTIEELSRAMSMVHMTSYLPFKTQEYLDNEIRYRFPELGKKEDKYFWEEDSIFCTLNGISRREEELRRITEEKMPQISEAIGKAASLGDLSENAEWTAALEEQRLLTEKATLIQDELAKVKAIEEQAIPEGVAAPGTRVTIQKEGDDERESFTILGPWDIGEPGVVSYQAPLAIPLLGRRDGEEVTMELPDKTVEATVIKVERL